MIQQEIAIIYMYDIYVCTLEAEMMVYSCGPKLLSHFTSPTFLSSTYVSQPPIICLRTIPLINVEECRQYIVRTRRRGGPPSTLT
jgi:hypothetical protein